MLSSYAGMEQKWLDRLIPYTSLSAVDNLATISLIGEIVSYEFWELGSNGRYIHERP